MAFTELQTAREMHMTAFERNPSGHIYRVDKFIVPEHVRDEFLSKVEMTHKLLKTLPGFLQDLVLEQTSRPGEFNFVTVVEWESDASMESARTVVAAMHEEIGFNPREVLPRLGIKADLANYWRIET
jgi:hypothetical protein